MPKNFTSVIVLLLSAALAPAAITPPPQPDKGPGGAEYSHAGFTAHSYGEEASQYWIFEPTGPVPTTAPLVIFCHGWGAMSPNAYGAWIEHLVRRGNIVVFPRYQQNLLTSMKDFTPNAEAAVKAALVELSNSTHVKAELDHVATVGHSMGGAIAVNLAALLTRDGLLGVRAVCSVEPGNHSDGSQRMFMPLEDFSQLKPGLLVQVIVGEDDALAGESTANEIYTALLHLPAADRNYIRLMSDDHGKPKLAATHFAPVANKQITPEDSATTKLLRLRLRERLQAKRSAEKPDDTEVAFGAVDALDYFGTWKLFDALCDAAFFNREKDTALGNTPAQRYMGRWSDGTLVKELVIVDPGH